MRTKTYELFNITSITHEYHAYAFTETSCNEGIRDSELFNPNIFNVFKTDRDFVATNTGRVVVFS